MTANMSEQGATPPTAAVADGNANAVCSKIINVDSNSEETPDVLKKVWDCKDMLMMPKKIYNGTPPTSSCWL